MKDKDVAMQINGTKVNVSVDSRMSLLDLLREKLRMSGTKKGCDQGACGACTVLVDGERVLSCLALAVQYEGRKVTTIEGLTGEDGLHPLQRAFIDNDGFQCGYCTPGQSDEADGLETSGPGVRDPSTVHDLGEDPAAVDVNGVGHRLPRGDLLIGVQARRPGLDCPTLACERVVEDQRSEPGLAEARRLRWVR